MSVEDIAQLVLHERQARDRGWWDGMRECYAPDATVRLSWFQGSARDFVDRSQDMADRGDTSWHRLGPPIVDRHQDRALVEMAAAIEVRTVLDDIEVDLVSYARLLYRTTFFRRRWWITSLDPVYERDTLTPVLPGTQFPVPSVRGLRRSYQFLAYVLDRRGYPIAGDLFGDDRPTEVAQLYDRLFVWLQGENS